MSNYKAITGSSKIVHRNQGGGSKLQGIASSTNLNTWAHVAFRNRKIVCPCNRNLIFCMNQLGGVGAGGIPGRSYAFAPSADGTHKQFYCGHRFVNGRWLIYPKNNIIAKYPDNVFFGFAPTDPDSGIPLAGYSFPLVINNTYKVIINNKTAIFKIIESFRPSFATKYYFYKIHVINSGNIREYGIIYYAGILYPDFDSIPNKPIKQNDTSFELSVINN